MLMPSLFRPVYQGETARRGAEETWHLRIMKELHLLDEWHGMKECLLCHSLAKSLPPANPAPRSPQPIAVGHSNVTKRGCWALFSAVRFGSVGIGWDRLLRAFIAFS